jgi:biotin-dependent carboxylase-like uncharacterized protein
MGLLVLHPGLSTTVQDRGRPGYRAWGVPPGGAFDQRSAGLANALLGNPPDAAVIEFTLVGGTYLADGTLALALAGAELEARVEARSGDNGRVEMPAAFPLYEGDRLVIGNTSNGARAYLAVQGGWQTAAVLGSRSSEKRLQAGDHIPCLSGSTPIRRLAPSRYFDIHPTLRVIAGPDACLLGSEWLAPAHAYRVGSQSNRMGFRFEGPTWPIPADPERISSPVAPGAIQCAGGQPLLLGVACGTMGGYPHVAHVISADLDRVGQLRPGEIVRFERVALAEARRLDRDYQVKSDVLFQRIATAARDRPQRP